MTDDVAVVFFCGSSEEFEGDDEEDCADTATGEESARGYVPG